MAIYTTQQISAIPYGTTIVYSFKILVDGVAIKESTPTNPPVDWDNLPEGWVGEYNDRIFQVQVCCSLDAQAEIVKFVTKLKSNLETPATPQTINEISI